MIRAMVVYGIAARRFRQSGRAIMTMPSETIHTEQRSGATILWVLILIGLSCALALVNFEGYYLYLLRVSPTHIDVAMGQTAAIGSHGKAHHYVHPAQLKLLSGGAVGAWLVMAYSWMLLCVCIHPVQLQAFFRSRSNQIVIHLIPAILAAGSLYYWMRLAAMS